MASYSHVERWFLGVVLVVCAIPQLLTAQAASSISFMPLPEGATACASGPAGVVGGVACYVSPLTPNAEIWTINEPRVNARETDYEQIRLTAGDIVSVFAGGCVQTGGRGLTWKRYVVPITGGLTHDEDHLYYGSIEIDGAIPQQRLKDAMKHGAFEVQLASSNSYVRLFYSDDGYGDNGYGGRDNGTWNQCDRLPEAFVVLAIQHGCVGTSPAAGPCFRGLALDLTAKSEDANGLLNNPAWTWSQLTSTLAPVVQLCSLSYKLAGMGEDSFSLCASDTQKNTYGGCWNDNDVGDIRGHVNFGPVGYQVSNAPSQTSSLNLDGHEWDDDDYTWNLERPDAAMYTFDRPDKIQMEFDSDETIDHFGSPAWQEFHSAVDAGGSGYPKFNDQMAGASGIIVGEAGVDCPHACIPELHPVYGLAIHMPGSTMDDDYWVFFARNWGDEGYCGRGTVPFQTGALNFFLPAIFARSVQINSQAVEGYAIPTNPTLSLVAEKGAILSIPLADPSKNSFVDGQIHLKWTRTIPPRFIDRPIAVSRFPNAAITTVVKRNMSQENEDDEAFDASVRKLSIEQQVRLHSLTTTPKVMTRKLTIAVVTATVAERAKHPSPAQPLPNPAYSDRIQRARQALTEIEPKR